ncbi:tautomerase family protein [Mesorhizobium sp. AR02]|uniref:tautomerase family protein n=1 Tax=Mesorhizobium sp. AR02 TaxID=2865837 RepID=UPI002160327D|nr:tautomerase family protein [Mesorhizobium sp. AR02]UVK52833.1 tautomerase family protein [Mesorhizobium sp. AR02]
MPHVFVTVIGNAPTQEQKSALFSKISNLLVTVLGPARKLTLVSVRTEPAENWSVGGDEAEDAGLVGVEAVIRTVAGSSVENRARMIGETTTVLREVLGTPILPLFVVMEEIAPESWGYDGNTIAQIRADKNK